MTEPKDQLAQMFAACWKDEALKARFVNDPKTVLAEYGLEIPDGIDVKVVENTEECVYITLPARHDSADTLSDEELLDVAGGGCQHNSVCVCSRHQGPISACPPSV